MPQAPGARVHDSHLTSTFREGRHCQMKPEYLHPSTKAHSPRVSSGRGAHMTLPLPLPSLQPPPYQPVFLSPEKKKQRSWEALQLGSGAGAM